ncbi:GH36-type glycosyl hydrolase domain-containing protein [Gorillibacterium sp. sgz5001074]|uniref:GH36-type glycosyl hydrolase domain-containing protein n=1 Tax=Gorillibacterium sp. sgz5001074 TaxID=3446695 RepID=UPI003F679FF4
MNQPKGWTFMNENGSFALRTPQDTQYLYFPLVNEAGMMSSVTPTLHGDAKTGHNTFLTPPVSVEDLHNSRASRNFWVHIEGEEVWSAAGSSPKQHAEAFSGKREDTLLEAGFLWHKITRTHPALGLTAEITSFVPNTDDAVEYMRVKLTNGGSRTLTVTPTAAIPMYARSADDLRDHRHVTSLLHRIAVGEYGVHVQPSLSFDERGHRVNRVTYSVLGAEGDGTAPVGFFPVLEDYIGEGGSLEWPKAVVTHAKPHAAAGDSAEGYESVGALRFREADLAPGESRTYVLALTVEEDRPDETRLARDYLSEARFGQLLEESVVYWEAKLGKLAFRSGDRDHDLWMKWVTLQPVLRRLFGNSFLPYHDYGRGGRGWRDLWQDCLALLFTEPAEVRHLLLNNFAGIRMDGSNATIIGSKPGEFIADRNNIPRVWMDHGAWPFLTVLLYLHQSGDLGFLLEEQPYFKDIHIKRCKDKDLEWKPLDGSVQRTADGEIYRGTVLEHLLLQNLVPFYHVGEHNIIKLEGADWNDGMDMGTKRGESVAFTAFYASNLMELGKLLRELERRTGLAEIQVSEEMVLLFDTLSAPIDYGSIGEKHRLLDAYYERTGHTVSGRRTALKIGDAARDLEQKGQWLARHLQEQEWIAQEEGIGWFNGYYDDDGNRVEGVTPDGVRMTLTGQVFHLMGGTATEEQAAQMAAAVNRHLKDPRIGYRLNTDFGGIRQNLGRAFGFAFGHKENGAMFSHMAVMYANALYKRGFVREGHDVLDSIYRLSADFERSRMYPGVPEYINERGRGMYPYLTGSASWLLLTELTEVYGVKGGYGDLLLDPKLLRTQFDAEGKAGVVTLFAGKMLRIVYSNPNGADAGAYTVRSVRLNGSGVETEQRPEGCAVKRETLLAAGGEAVDVEVELI